MTKVSYHIGILCTHTHNYNQLGLPQQRQTRTHAHIHTCARARIHTQSGDRDKMLIKRRQHNRETKATQQVNGNVKQRQRKRWTLNYETKQPNEEGKRKICKHTHNIHYWFMIKCRISQDPVRSCTRFVDDKYVCITLSVLLLSFVFFFAHCGFSFFAIQFDI